MPVRRKFNVDSGMQVSDHVKVPTLPFRIAIKYTKFEISIAVNQLKNAWAFSWYSVLALMVVRPTYLFAVHHVKIFKRFPGISDHFFVQTRTCLTTKKKRG